MLMTITVFQNKCFDKDSRPCKKTIMKWIRDGEIYAKKIGGMYYIDPDKEEFTPVNSLVTKAILTLNAR